MHSFIHDILSFVLAQFYPHRYKWTKIRKTAFKKNGVKGHRQILKKTSMIVSPLCYFSTKLLNWNSLSPTKPMKSHVHPWASQEMSPESPFILANWFTSWSLMQLPGFHLWIKPANSWLVKLSWLTEYHRNISQRCSERNWKGLRVGKKQIKSVSSDRWVIPSLIACPYLNDGMENSQFPRNVASFLGPTNSKAADEAHPRVTRCGCKSKGQESWSSLNIYYPILFTSWVLFLKHVNSKLLIIYIAQCKIKH